MKTPGTKKTKQGLVVKRSGDKSVVVRVERMVKHPIVKKYVRRHTKFHVHDPENTCVVGDEIVILESRPISKNKRWVFQQLVKRDGVTAPRAGE